MATSKIQITLDDRLVAVLGDDRSGNVKEALIQLYKLNRMTLMPEVKVEYTGGAKAPVTVKGSPMSTSSTHRHVATPVDTRTVLDTEEWAEELESLYLGDPDTTPAEAESYMNARFILKP